MARTPKYNEKRRTEKPNKNTTVAKIILGNTAEALNAARAHVREFFQEIPTRYKADAKYGLQHYNQEGFLHPDGLTRLGNQSLTMLGLQIAETLSIRASHSNDSVYNSRQGPDANSQTAIESIALLTEFLNVRSGEIQAEKRQDTLQATLKELGVESLEDLKGPATSKGKGKNKTTVSS